MNAATERALAAINRRFYHRHARAFSDARSAPWPGWARLVPALRERAARGPLRVLDVGCGNGRFARFLAEALPGTELSLVGVDASGPLLAIARAAGSPRACWRRLDAAAEPEALPAEPFDLVALLAMIHGVPGRARRLALLEACARRLAPGGRLVLTTWRFERERRLEWRAYNARAREPIDTRELEPGDALLRWGEGDAVVRYFHLFDEGELASWVERLGLDVEQRYRADGRSGDSNEYLVLRAR